MRARNHAQRRADARRRQPAGIAMGEKTAAGRHEFASGACDALAQVAVFLHQA